MPGNYHFKFDINPMNGLSSIVQKLLDQWETRKGIFRPGKPHKEETRWTTPTPLISMNWNVKGLQCVVQIVHWLNRQHTLIWAVAHINPDWRHRRVFISKVHDDVIKWKHFPRYWSFLRGSTGHWWIPLTKASDAELWWTNGWANNRDDAVNWDAITLIMTPL